MPYLRYIQVYKENMIGFGGLNLKLAYVSVRVACAFILDMAMLAIAPKSTQRVIDFSLASFKWFWLFNKFTGVCGSY